jgi:hypothetical protein
LLDKIKNELSEDQIYILEKYVFGLHQDEERPYEIWFKEMLTDLTVNKSTINSNILIYNKNGDVLYNYNEKTRYLWINYDKIWSVFISKFDLNYYEIKVLTKGMLEEHFNLKGITTIPIVTALVGWLEEHFNLKGITTGLGSKER